MNPISLLISSILTENIVLTKFLGICPFMGTSGKKKDAIGMSIAVTIVTTISSIITYIIYNYVLVPTNSEYLKTLMFIFVIACMVQMLLIVIKNKFLKLYQSLGIYLPLITTNCAVLGIALLNVNSNFSFVEMLIHTIGSCLGFSLVICLFGSLRENLSDDIPKCFKGYPIAFITAGIMALIFGRII